MTVHELTRPETRTKTLRDRHNILVAEAQVMTALLERMEVPPRPSVYDRHGERQWMLESYNDYAWCLFEKLLPILERIAEDARDYAGARIESPEIIRGAMSDYLAGIATAIEQLENDR